MIKRLRTTLIAAALLSLVGTVSTVPAQQPLKDRGLPQQNTDLYSGEPQPLTLEQCGQCHPVHFRDIKQSGGKHQFDCRECHTVFHVYNPRKENYTDIMPDCQKCHDLIHGKKHSHCLSCHSNPHAASESPPLTGVVDACADCHSDQIDELTGQPSRHTELSCDNCHHTEHGTIPSCSECHQPHFSGQSFARCSRCHSPHQPLSTAFPSDVDLKNCSGCHTDIFTKWSQTASRHGRVSCSECHSAHMKIPDCQDCHGIPPAHSKTMLDKFPRCLDCHLDVHDLPTKK